MVLTAGHFCADTLTGLMPFIIIVFTASSVSPARRQQWEQHITSEQTRELWGDLETAATKMMGCTLEWLGHMAWMAEHWTPKMALFGWLPQEVLRRDRGAGSGRIWRFGEVRNRVLQAKGSLADHLPQRTCRPIQPTATEVKPATEPGAMWGAWKNLSQSLGQG